MQLPYIQSALIFTIFANSQLVDNGCLGRMKPGITRDFGRVDFGGHFRSGILFHREVGHGGQN